MIVSQLNTNTLLIVFQGDLNGDSVPTLKREFARLSEANVSTPIVLFDMGLVEDADSIGLSFLFGLFREDQYRIGARVLPSMWQFFQSINTRVPIFHKHLPTVHTAQDYASNLTEARRLEDSLHDTNDPENLFTRGEIFRVRWEDAFLAREFYKRATRNGGPMKPSDRALCYLLHGLNLARDRSFHGADRAFHIALECEIVPHLSIFRRFATLLNLLGAGSNDDPLVYLRHAMDDGTYPAIAKVVHVAFSQPFGPANTGA